MSHVSTGQVIVIRRKFDFAIGWTGIAALCLLVLWVIFFSPPDDGFWYVAQIIPVIWPVLWLSWLATVHPKLELSESGLGVTNWFYRYRIPWPAVHWIQSGDQTIVHTVDGLKIKPAVGGWSLAGRARGNPQQKQISEQVAEFRKNVARDGDGGIQVSRSLDLHPLPFVAVLVVFVALAAIVR